MKSDSWSPRVCFVNQLGSHSVRSSRSFDLTTPQFCFLRRSDSFLPSPAQRNLRITYLSSTLTIHPALSRRRFRQPRTGPDPATLLFDIAIVYDLHENSYEATNSLCHELDIPHCLCSGDLAQLSIPRRPSILLHTYSFHVCDVAQSSHELHSSQWPRSMFWHSQTIGQEGRVACRLFSVCQVRRLIAPCATD